MNVKAGAKMTAREICLIAMFSALLAVCAWISVPLPGGISVTLQTMAVCLAAGLLGWKRGLVSVTVYILLGVCGVPVFTGFRAIEALSSVTGGYIVGFLFTALCVGIVADYVRIGNKWLYALVLGVSMAVGILMCYAFGTAWFILLFRSKGTEMTLTAALTACVVPYLLPDLVKIIAATFLAMRLKKYIRI